MEIGLRYVSPDKKGEMMTNNKYALAVRLFFIVILICCGKPAQSEEPPTNKNDLTSSVDVPPVVDQTAPLYQGAAKNVEGGGESLEEMKKRIGMDNVWPSEVPEHDYVGVRKCALCHKKEAAGSQYPIWKETAHAKAFDTLGTEEAKALAQKLGIEDPQQSGKCLRCHSTAYAFGEQRVTNVIPVEEGLSCETCHGPGKDYMKLKTMKNREKAVAAGLIIPNEQTCLKCHNQTAPNVKPFDFHESWEKIKHPVPEKP